MITTKRDSFVVGRNGRGPSEPMDLPIGQWTRSQRFSVFFTMAESSTNDIIDLLERFFQILKEENVFDRSDDQPVVQFMSPSDLQKMMAIDLHNEPATERELEKLIRQIIQYSVKTSHPHFHNQLYAGVDVYGLIGSWLTEVLNTSQYTYEVAPVFTLIEQELLEKSMELVGYLPETADGILCPGGSISNMYGMMMARFKKIPSSKANGICGHQGTLVCFTSEDGHYSILKAAHWLGIGTNNVWKVKTDKFGRMRINELKYLINQARRKKLTPFFVNATAGTTVLGAIDPLPEIARICNAQNIWLHVDACLGGSLLLSETYANRLKGIELSDSVAWNPHKLLGVPLQCSIFLTREKNMLHQMNCAKANYLFQPDKFYDIKWDTGDKSVQCGRKTDAMKFWLMWKARGKNGLGRSVDRAMSCAEYFLKRISEKGEKGKDKGEKDENYFRLVQSQYQCTNICFWYVPPSLRKKKEDDKWWDEISEATVTIKKRMVEEGSLMITFTPLPQKELKNFFRMVVNCEPPPTESSMDYVIQQIERLAKDL